LSAQIIVNKFGNLGTGASVFSTVKQGYDEGLFEVGIHGFNHIRHSQVSEEQQSTDFESAKTKLKLLFNDPNLRIFTPPFNDFDSNTIRAMAENSMDIFSSSYTSERTTTNVYKVSSSFQTDNSIIQLSEVTVFDNDSRQHLKRRIYHVPFDISIFNMIEPTGTLSGQSLVDAVLAKAASQIANSGFAIITLHPTDIAPYSSASGSWSNTVSATKFQDIKDIIRGLGERGYGFSFMSEVTPAPFSQVVPGGTRTPLLTLNSIANVGWGTNITATGKLTDYASTAPIGNANIKFDGTGATNLTSVVTNPDGTFIAKGKSPSTVGTGWKVQAYFTGDSTYEATNSLPKTYNTIAHSVTIAVAASKSTVPWGAATTFSATMTDTTVGASGKPVSGKIVNLDGTGATGIAASNQATDINGKVTFTGLAPTSVGTGWTYQAHFAGDSLYKKFDSTIRTYSTVLHKTAFTFIKPTAVPWGKNVVLTTTLQDSSLAKPLSGATITFDNNNATNVGSAQTDTNGKAIYTVMSPNSVGTFPYAAHYAGDGSLYSKADATGTYTTIKHTVSLGLAVLKTGDPSSTTSTTVTPGGSYKAQGTLLDTVTSVPLASKAITLTADPPITISSKTTNTNGFYSGTQTAPTTSGTYNIQSHFAMDDLYNAKDSAIRTLTVSGSTTTSTSSLTTMQSSSLTKSTKSTTSSATEPITSENLAPTADAGPGKRVQEGTNDFVLDGAHSKDSDGTVVKYQWEQTAGPRVKLDTTSRPGHAIFDVPEIQRDGTKLIFALAVEDDEGKKSEVRDTVTVIITDVENGDDSINNDSTDANSGSSRGSDDNNRDEQTLSTKSDENNSNIDVVRATD
jgi:peptidoglycan/xylan/chitin deacetylase (PgdA/CDA1 family)